MDPDTALRLQIDAYLRMTGEERLLIALRLHELSCEDGAGWHPASTSERQPGRGRNAVARTAEACTEAWDMTESELLVDCLRRLNASGLAYFLTGSMASNYWGMPRTTHDLDFVVQLRAEDVAIVVHAFAGDFFIQESSVRSALNPPHQFNALDQRSPLKVDFWVLRDDAFEQQMFARRQLLTLLGTPAWLGSAEDVLLHKLLWNKMTPSIRQLQDAVGIWAVQAQNLDLDYLARWSRELQVEDVFEQIRGGAIRPKKT